MPNCTRTITCDSIDLKIPSRVISPHLLGNKCLDVAFVSSPVPMLTPLPADDIPSTSLKMGGTHFLLCSTEGTS